MIHDKEEAQIKPIQTHGTNFENGSKCEGIRAHLGQRKPQKTCTFLVKKSSVAGKTIGFLLRGDANDGFFGANDQIIANNCWTCQDWTSKIVDGNNTHFVVRFHYRDDPLAIRKAPRIFERLSIDPMTWTILVRDFGRMFCQVAGTPKVIDEARSRKTGRRFYVRQQARELLASV